MSCPESERCANFCYPENADMIHVTNDTPKHAPKGDTDTTREHRCPDA